MAKDRHYTVQVTRSQIIDVVSKNPWEAELDALDIFAGTPARCQETEVEVIYEMAVYE